MSDEHNNALATFFNVDSLKPWTGRLSGTALGLPDEYKSFVLRGELYIEYLQNNGGQGEVDAGVPNKNHVVFQVPFAQDYLLEIEGLDVMIRGARMSMDLTNEDESLKNINKDRLESEFIGESFLDDYFPGTVYVKLLKYDGQSIAANKITMFSDLDVATLGGFIDFVKVRKLHEMSFMGYKEAWKGCRHFITQTVLQLRSENKVSETHHEGHSLKHNIMRVHHEGSGSHVKLVDRGKFLTYVPIYPDEIADAYEKEQVGDEDVGDQAVKSMTSEV